DGKGEQVLEVDWKAIIQDGRTATNHALRPGDRVYIEPALPPRTTVLPAGADPNRLPPPSESDVLRALPNAWDGPIAVTSELLNRRLDEPRSFPLVGPARLAHTHWKCTVS